MGKHEKTGFVLADSAISYCGILHGTSLVSAKLEVKENSDQQISNQMTTWKYQELKATGFSTYIGKPIDQLEKDFGQAYDRLTSGFGFETDIMKIKLVISHLKRTSKTAESQLLKYCKQGLLISRRFI